MEETKQETDEMLAALNLALPYVQRVAATAPTTLSRMERQLRASKDVAAIRAVIAKATA